MKAYLLPDEKTVVFNEETVKKRAKMEGEYEEVFIDLRDFTNENLDELNEGVIKTTNEMAKDLCHKEDKDEVPIYQAHADDGMTVITITATGDGIVKKHNGEINDEQKPIRVNTNIKEEVEKVLYKEE